MERTHESVPSPEEARARERRWVERARNGDREAFEHLCREAYPALLHYARSLAGPDRAPDLAQEALLRALRSIDRFRGEARFRSWLLRIARNVWLNERALLRSKRERSGSQQVEERAGAHVDPAARLEREELVAALEREIATLPAAQREALLLCDREGLSYKEIAQVMGCPIGTVMSRIHYARTRLRRRLGRWWKNGRGVG
ncbi:MAG: sigma-70 family RNA polymerase sigma factor [Planctomycetota bacterium]|nr:MAG: sigma-70 family RNA polymerase sigma factor [Planctomycetota bacterium]